MNILMPMAGAGKRFADAGYAELKPLIPTTERRDGRQYPMAVCAMRDALLCADEAVSLIFVIRTDHEGDIRPVLLQHYPDAAIVGVDHLTEGQACTCLLARSSINNDEPLLIIGCDNGMVFQKEAFDAASAEADVLVFTYRHHEAVLKNPSAYGWVKVKDGTDIVTDVSVKRAISDHPMEDHAIVATFWFRRGSDFVRCAEEMIAADDRVNGEFYVDQVIRYCVKNGLDTRAFEIERYIGWGTPEDYENYENTLRYWRGFTHCAAFLPKDRGVTG